MIFFIIPIILIVVIVLMVFGYARIIDRGNAKYKTLREALLKYQDDKRWKCCQFWDTKSCKCDRAETLRTHFSGDDFANGWDFANQAFDEVRKL